MNWTANYDCICPDNYVFIEVNVLHVAKSDVRAPFDRSICNAASQLESVVCLGAEGYNNPRRSSKNRLCWFMYRSFNCLYCENQGRRT
mmetsp:Transcript_2340/g.8372  ORF Transcript_2340/g.8372 Transcript_2340/m.8372 type:complete len:88 (+) Transcript_2340:92-355(+)